MLNCHMHSIKTLDYVTVSTWKLKGCLIGVNQLKTMNFRH